MEIAARWHDVGIARAIVRQSVQSIADKFFVSAVGHDGLLR